MIQESSFLNTSRKRRLFEGKAPDCWKREMEQNIRVLDDLKRAGVYINEFAEILPKLNSETLFGNCLGYLTDLFFQRRVDEEQESLNNRSHGNGAYKKEEPDSRMQIFKSADNRSYSKDDKKGSKLSRHSSVSSLFKSANENDKPAKPERFKATKKSSVISQPSDILALSQESRFAGRELLESLAKKNKFNVSPLQSVNKNAGETVQVKRRSRVLPAPEIGFNKHKSTILPSNLKGYEKRQDWLHTLAVRAKQAMCRKGAERFGEFEGSQSNQSEALSDEDISLVKQLERRLDGQPAPPELLYALLMNPNREIVKAQNQVSGSKHRSNVPVRKRSYEESSAVNSNGNLIRGVSVPFSKMPFPDSEEKHSFFSRLKVSPGRKSTFSEQITDLMKSCDEKSINRTVQESTTNRRQDEFTEPEFLGKTSNIFPERLAKTPNISKEKDAPSLRKGKASVSLTGDKKGVVLNDSDLSDLATKIKHILDEEARRHGIDV